jgi:hypothetical protein
MGLISYCGGRTAKGMDYGGLMGWQWHGLEDAVFDCGCASLSRRCCVDLPSPNRTESHEKLGGRPNEEMHEVLEILDFVLVVGLFIHLP